MSEFKQRIKIPSVEDIPEGSHNHGVPLHLATNSILLGDIVREGNNSRIEVVRSDKDLRLHRTDGEPLQIGVVHTLDNIQLGDPLQTPIRGLRYVLSMPEPELTVVNEDGDWTLEVFLKDIDTGKHDMNKFFRKIATVSVAKMTKKST